MSHLKRTLKVEARCEEAVAVMRTSESGDIQVPTRQTSKNLNPLLGRYSEELMQLRCTSDQCTIHAAKARNVKNSREHTIQCNLRCHQCRRSFSSARLAWNICQLSLLLRTVKLRVFQAAAPSLETARCCPCSCVCSRRLRLFRPGILLPWWVGALSPPNPDQCEGDTGGRGR